MSFSPEERDKELARTIFEAFTHIQWYTEGIAEPEFLMDLKTQDVVCMRLQQILECAGKLSEATKSSLKIDLEVQPLVLCKS